MYSITCHTLGHTYKYTQCTHVYYKNKAYHNCVIRKTEVLYQQTCLCIERFMPLAFQHVRSCLSVSDASLCGEEYQFKTTCQAVTKCGNTI